MSATSPKDFKLKGHYKTHDGAIIEGTGIGGKVLIVKKTPDFIRDVSPYFAPSIILILAHVSYSLTGNLLFLFWLLYLVCPISNFVLPEDNQNLVQRCERTFHNDKRFWLPLYTYNLLETITWIWALIVMSDKVNPDSFWFQQKP